MNKPCTNKVTLGNFINAITDEHNIGEITKLAIVTDKLDVITDKNQIYNYEMLRDVITEPTSTEHIKVKNESVTLILTSHNAQNESVMTHTITLNFEEETDSTVFFRVTYTEQPQGVSDIYDIDDYNSENLGASSTLIGYDKKRVINDDALKEGTRLYDEQRFFEALPYILEVHDKMQKNYLYFNDGDKELFDDILYKIGFCYSELHQYVKGYFYLSFTTNNISNVQERLNCLANNVDIRALCETMNFINLVEKDLANKKFSDEERHSMERFRIFLLRRKAFACIDFGYYDDAEQTLNQLLDDPESRAFATNELEYLKQLKENQN